MAFDYILLLLYHNTYHPKTYKITTTHITKKNTFDKYTCYKYNMLYIFEKETNLRFESADQNLVIPLIFG